MKIPCHVASVTDRPDMILTLWSVWIVNGVTTHFVGRRWKGWTQSEERVSSPIVEWDPVTRRGRSVSGRVYQLLGPFGPTNRIWERWQEKNKVGIVLEVTSDFDLVKPRDRRQVVFDKVEYV